MGRFSYMAIDSRGQATKGTLQVTTQQDVLTHLREAGLYPLQVRDLGEPPDAGPPNKSAGGASRLLTRREWHLSGLERRVKNRELAAVTRQLASLVRAGLPLLRSLRVVAQQEANPRLRKILGDVGSEIESGGTFSGALEFHPKVFNRLYVSMVKAGEAGGLLDTVLMRLAGFMEKAEQLRRKIVSAMVYPTAVLVVAAAILSLLMLLVVPQFKLVFADLMPRGAELPKFTQIVIGLSEGLAHALPIIALVALGLGLAFRFWLRTPAGRYLFDQFKLRLPVVGPVVRKACIARFTRTFGTLATNGVPILQALTIVKETAGNQVVADAVGAVHESVKSGESVAAPLAASGVFPPVAINMVDVGEQSGALPEMLLTIADDYDDEVDHAVSAMTSLLEPILIVFLALIVGSIVIALYLPIIKIAMDGMDFAPGEP